MTPPRTITSVLVCPAVARLPRCFACRRRGVAHAEWAARSVLEPRLPHDTRRVCTPSAGTAQERAGNYKEAVKAYKMAIDLEPEEAKY